MRIVALADMVMSLDNVLAIAAAAHGDPWLIVFGLVVSIPLIVGGATLISNLLTQISDPGVGGRGAARLDRGRAHCHRARPATGYGRVGGRSSA